MGFRRLGGLIGSMRVELVMVNLESFELSWSCPTTADCQVSIIHMVGNESEVICIGVISLATDVSSRRKYD